MYALVSTGKWCSPEISPLHLYSQKMWIWISDTWNGSIIHEYISIRYLLLPWMLFLKKLIQQMSIPYNGSVMPTLGIFLALDSILDKGNSKASAICLCLHEIVTLLGKCWLLVSHSYLLVMLAICQWLQVTLLTQGKWLNTSDITWSHWQIAALLEITITCLIMLLFHEVTITAASHEHMANA